MVELSCHHFAALIGILVVLDKDSFPSNVMKEGQLDLMCLLLEGTLTWEVICQKAECESDQICLDSYTRLPEIPRTESHHQNSDRGKVHKTNNDVSPTGEFQGKRRKRGRDWEIKGKPAVIRHLKVYQPAAMPAPYWDPDWNKLKKRNRDNQGNFDMGWIFDHGKCCYFFQVWKWYCGCLFKDSLSFCLFIF